MEVAPEVSEAQQRLLHLYFVICHLEEKLVCLYLFITYITYSLHLILYTGICICQMSDQTGSEFTGCLNSAEGAIM